MTNGKWHGAWSMATIPHGFYMAHMVYGAERRAQGSEHSQIHTWLMANGSMANGNGYCLNG